MYKPSPVSTDNKKKEEYIFFKSISLCIHTHTY